MKRVFVVWVGLALVASAFAGYRVVIIGGEAPIMSGHAIEWPLVGMWMSHGPDTDRRRAPLVRDMLTGRTIDLRPRGMNSGQISSMANGVQAGHVTPADGARYYAAMWRGTPESFVWLHPFPTAAGFTSTVNDTDGTYQAGNAEDESRNLALVWKGTKESVRVYNPPGCRIAQAQGVDWPYVCGGAEGYGAILWNGGPESFVSLHPFPYRVSFATDTQGGVQVGYVGTRFAYAAIWRGSAATFRLLHTPGWLQSWLWRTNGTTHVGSAMRYPDYRLRAIAFRGAENPEFVDLNALLPPGFTESEAIDVDDRGVIIGNAYRSNQAYTVLWIPEFQ